VIDSDEDQTTSSDEDEDEFSSNSRESSYRASSKVSAVPKLSLPPRKGTPYKQSRFALSDDDDYEFDQDEDLIGSGDEDIDELPSTFETDDYIDEAVANEKDPINVNPEPNPHSFIEPTQKFLNKIGRRFSVSQSVLTSRISNLMQRYSDEAPESPTDTDQNQIGEETLDSKSIASPVTVAPLKLSLAQPSNLERTTDHSPPQIRTRQGLLSRISQAFAPALGSSSGAEPVRLKDSDSMVEVNLNSNRSAAEKSRLTKDDEPHDSDDDHPDADE